MNTEGTKLKPSSKNAEFDAEDDGTHGQGLGDLEMGEKQGRSAAFSYNRRL